MRHLSETLQAFATADDIRIGEGLGLSLSLSLPALFSAYHLDTRLRV